MRQLTSDPVLFFFNNQSWVVTGGCRIGNPNPGEIRCRFFFARFIAPIGRAVLATACSISVVVIGPRWSTMSRVTILRFSFVCNRILGGIFCGVLSSNPGAVAGLVFVAGRAPDRTIQRRTAQRANLLRDRVPTAAAARNIRLGSQVGS